MTPREATVQPLRAALLCALALSAACGKPAAPAIPTTQTPPALPPLQLRSRIGELKELAATLPAAPPSEQRELAELAEIATQAVATDTRTMARAERSLLAHEFAWAALTPLLLHEVASVRHRAAWLCGKSQQPAAVPALLLRLKYELDPEAVLWVADALQQLGNDAGLLWLDAAIGAGQNAERAGAMAITLCQERSIELPDPPTYAALQQSLRRLAEQWRQTGRSSRPNAPLAPMTAMEPQYAAGLALTEGTLLRPIDDAKFIISRSGELPVPLLARTLAASEPYLRTVALGLLGDLGHAAAAAAPAVLPLLGDRLTEAYAVRTLGEIGATTALPYLRQRLREGDTELRAAAATALGMLRDADSKPALEQAMNAAGEALDVRVAAAFALRRLGEHAAAESFLQQRETQRDFHESKLRQLRERLAW